VGRSQRTTSRDAASETRFAGSLSDDYPLWRLARPFLGEVHGTVTAELAKYAKAHPGPLKAIDIGMGDGAITELLLAEPKLKVVGVDNEPKMVFRAQEALRDALEGGRLKVVLDDALSFLGGRPAGSVDIAASGYVLHNLTEAYRDGVYDQIFRVLKPGGLLINADKYAQSGQAHRDALNWQLGRFFDVLVPRQKYDLLRDWVLHYVEDELPGRVMPEVDAIARLKRAGFADIAIVYRKHMDAVLVARKPQEHPAARPQ
jgi:tRNA (cmo5U34)-methyltransferase